MLTGVVLTRDERENLSRCLEALRFCDRVVVVDDFSGAKTVQVARACGAQVLRHRLGGNFAAQRNWALENIKSSWVLFVDADEVVSPELAGEIATAVRGSRYVGYRIRRQDNLWGKVLVHGDVGGVWLVRLARRGSGQWTGRVHETWNVQGPVGRLKSPLLHYPHPDEAEFLRHLNRYSSIRARELFDQGKRGGLVRIVSVPPAKFMWLYVVRQGFRDGTVGFIHAMNMAFYSFLVQGKLYLLGRGIGIDDG